LDSELADDEFQGWTSAIWRESSQKRGGFARLWCLIFIDFAASLRDCHCGRMLRAVTLGDPLALNVRLKTENSGHVETPYLRHGTASGTTEIERGIIVHWNCLQLLGLR
jgi:hypothetical protein